MAGLGTGHRDRRGRLLLIGAVVSEKKFKVDHLKIDRAMGHGLGIPVIAEAGRMHCMRIGE